MPRLRSPRGVVVNVNDATAASLTGFTVVDEAASEPEKKPAPKKATRKSDK